VPWHAGKPNGEMPLTGAGSCGYMPFAGAAGGFTLPAPERAAAGIPFEIEYRPCLKTLPVRHTPAPGNSRAVWAKAAVAQW
jgi:hypothetical protein